MASKLPLWAWTSKERVGIQHCIMWVWIPYLPFILWLRINLYFAGGSHGRGSVLELVFVKQFYLIQPLPCP